MDCNISILIDEQIVHLRVEQETISHACIYKLLNEAANHGIEQHLYRCLFDIRGIHNPDENEADTLLDFKQISNLGYYLKSRTAIILDEPIDEWHQQVESYFQEVGFEFRMFTAREPAVAWLKSPFNSEQPLSLLS